MSLLPILQNCKFLVVEVLEMFELRCSPLAPPRGGQKCMTHHSGSMSTLTVETSIVMLEGNNWIPKNYILASTGQPK